MPREMNEIFGQISRGVVVGTVGKTEKIMSSITWVMRLGDRIRGLVVLLLRRGDLEKGTESMSGSNEGEGDREPEPEPDRYAQGIPDVGRTTPPHHDSDLLFEKI